MGCKGWTTCSRFQRLLANEQQTRTTADRFLIGSVKLEQQRNTLAEYNYAQEGTQNWREYRTEIALCANCLPQAPTHYNTEHFFERRFAPVWFQAEFRVKMYQVHKERMLGHFKLCV